jgi:hypothetical protein
VTARRLVLADKVRPYPLALVGPDHFRFSEGAPVDPATVRGPGHSLYCLDHDRRRALFVETPPDADLSAHPFYYQAQYEAARGLVAVPYDALHDLADRVDARPLVLIHSVGRCGSTLVHRALAAVPGAESRSEPDVFTQLVTLREAGRCDPAEVAGLVRTCGRLLFGTAADTATPDTATPDTATPDAPAADRPLVVKFRSFALELGDLIHRHFPHARTVFLYRHAVAWGRSSARAFGSYDPTMARTQAIVQDRLALMIPPLARYRARKGRLLTPVEALACQWVGLMTRAVALREAGVPMYAARYEDLVADPRGVLAAIFVHCGLPAPGPVELDRILAADSQAGTSLSRRAVEAGPDAGGLTDEQVDELRAAIGELSGDIAPDLVIPNETPAPG